MKIFLLNDILTEKDVESIHRNLLTLIPENSPQKAQIRTSLKNHLLAELNSLMQQKKWIEADKKNWQFSLKNVYFMQFK